MPNRVPKACVTVCRWPAPACVNLRCAADWSASGACSRVPLACAGVCQTARPAMAFLHRTNDSKVGPSLRLNLLATCPSPALACAGVWFWRVPQRGSGVCQYIWRGYFPVPELQALLWPPASKAIPKGIQRGCARAQNCNGLAGLRSCVGQHVLQRGSPKAPILNFKM